MDSGRHWTAKSRTAAGNRQLSRSLAFIAGATNAGAFLAVRQQSAHRTGIVSLEADGEGPTMQSALSLNFRRCH
jgi:hypothetical protein